MDQRDLLESTVKVRSTLGTKSVPPLEYIKFQRSNAESEWAAGTHTRE